MQKGIRRVLHGPTRRISLEAQLRPMVGAISATARTFRLNGPLQSDGDAPVP